MNCITSAIITIQVVGMDNVDHPTRAVLEPETAYREFLGRIGHKTIRTGQVNDVDPMPDIPPLWHHRRDHPSYLHS